MGWGRCGCRCGWGGERREYEEYYRGHVTVMCGVATSGFETVSICKSSVQVVRRYDSRKYQVCIKHLVGQAWVWLTMPLSEELFGRSLPPIASCSKDPNPWGPLPPLNCFAQPKVAKEADAGILADSLPTAPPPRTHRAITSISSTLISFVGWLLCCTGGTAAASAFAPALTPLQTRDGARPSATPSSMLAISPATPAAKASGANDEQHNGGVGIRV